MQPSGKLYVKLYVTLGRLAQCSLGFRGPQMDILAVFDILPCRGTPWEPRDLGRYVGFQVACSTTSADLAILDHERRRTTTTGIV